MNSITLQGNILTYDILERIATDQEGSQAPKDYGFSNKSEILSQLETNWGNIKMLFGAYQNRLESLPEEDSGVSLTRKWWMNPFLSELGYEIELNKAGQIINERNYFVSHQDNKLNGFPVHIIGANQSLDKKYTGMRMSSHAMIQEYLNHHENLYALVTNGRYLRLLRDSQLLTKVSYVEFDLHKMITEDQFSDFVLLWKLLHVTRMPEEPENGNESIIEQYHLNSLESGSRIREKLSEAVKHGITMLANGLIQEEQNEHLRTWLEESQIDRPKEYYGELLRLIYRILFVMVIEERDLIYPAELSEDEQKKKNIYYQYYSLQRLRRLAINHYYGNDQHYDLWQYMMNVFSLYEGSKGQKLGIQALAGDLFSSIAISHIRECQLNNDILLQVFKGLTLFENDQGQFITVNYKSLDVEEFGSVYEGLLELDPAIDVSARRFSFVKGDDRSISGSHYTPDELVQPLIKHSLEHLIQDIVKPIYEEETKSKKLNQEKRQSGIAAFLKLTVCDVACGSGHILLAAARRIGLEIARLRSGEEQPNPEDSRKGTRDAIRHCIYGVDKNPLAVELCKVAMWLEAHVPGEPLNFLDHKIKNGDAIVGLARMEELYNGIATEAFKAYKDDEKENCRILKASNKKQRKAREAGQLRLQNVKEIVENKLKGYKEKFEAFAALPESSIEEIKAKKQAHKKLNSGGAYWFVKGLADLQVAQFFVDKSEMANVATDDDYFDIMAGRKTQTKSEVMALAESTKRNFFHWFLEFPEVFAQGGFSTILGNPPYLGGTKISTHYGDHFLKYLHANYSGAGNRCDLIGYFIRRISTLMSSYFSIISTDTVSEGDTRKGSLEHIINSGKYKISHALKSTAWPGDAQTRVSIITIKKSTELKYQPVLDNKIVDNISAFLSDELIMNPSESLIQNSGLIYTGTKIYGEGFLINESELFEFMRNKDSEIIQKYLTGDDINNDVEQDSKRWVINFHDWSEEKAKSFPKAYTRIKETVYPQRQNLRTDPKAKKNWWQYQRRRPELYSSISKFKDVLLMAQTAKYILPTFVQNKYVYSVKCIVFSRKDLNFFAILQSCFHISWAWKNKTSMGGSTIQYSTGNCFDNFARPQFISDSLNSHITEISSDLIKLRFMLNKQMNLGLTKVYNQFNNENLLTDSEKDISDLSNAAIKKDFAKESWYLYNHLQKTEDTISFSEAAEKIAELRQLHVEMDLAVLEAYGWHQDTKRWGPAIDLRHDFYEVDYLPENDRVRYTIHPDARKEVLKRLLLLNHEIHESEKRGISYEELDKEKIMEIYQEEIGGWLDRPEVLHPKTLKYLAHAEELHPDLKKKAIKEFSPYVAEICKSLENEILHKLFIPFTKKVKEEWTSTEEEWNSYMKDQKSKKLMSKFAGHIKQQNLKYTLGDMHFLLDLIWKEKSSVLDESKILRDFKVFAYKTYTADFINQDSLNKLKSIFDIYRNASAHADETFEKEDGFELYDIDENKADECRKAVRELINLIVKSEIQ